MARTKGDGARVPLNRIYQYKVKVSDADWRKIETLGSIALTKESKAKILLITKIYSSFGPLYSPRQSILAKDAAAAIKSWIAASKKLTAALTPVGADLSNFIPKVDERLFAKMMKLPPVGRVALLGLISEAAGQMAINSFSGVNKVGRLAQDQWAAWVCLITREFKKAGLKISGKSLDRSSSESPYVAVLLICQSWLPGECRHCNSYESMRKGAQTATKTMGKLLDQTLFQIIVWSSHLLPSFPGNLRHAPQETLLQFDQFAQQVLERAAAGLATGRPLKAV